MIPYIKHAIVVVVLIVSQLSANAGGEINKQDTIEDKRVNFAPIPYVNYDRSIGFSAGFMPMVMYSLNPKDTISPPSVSGLMGMYSTNHTWFLMGFSKFYFNEDKWRFSFGGGWGNINYQFYLANPINDYIHYNTAAKFLGFRLFRKTYKDLYLGASMKFVSYDNSLEHADTTLNSNELKGMGLLASYDKRDNVYYPTKGALLDFSYNFFPSFLGNTDESQLMEFALNNYFPMRQNRDVLATRAFVGLGLNDVTFNQQFIVGKTDIRGYTQGTYRGNQLYALQAEYRWNFHDKMGAVGFLGMASIYDAVNESDNGKILPGAGIGFRYEVFKKNKMNVGLDAAIGKDDWGIYFKVGEAF